MRSRNGFAVRIETGRNNGDMDFVVAFRIVCRTFNHTVEYVGQFSVVGNGGFQEFTDLLEFFHGNITGNIDEKRFCAKNVDIFQKRT